MCRTNLRGNRTVKEGKGNDVESLKSRIGSKYHSECHPMQSDVGDTISHTVVTELILCLSELSHQWKWLFVIRYRSDGREPRKPEVGLRMTTLETTTATHFHHDCHSTRVRVEIESEMEWDLGVRVGGDMLPPPSWTGPRGCPNSGLSVNPFE